ncbi:N-formylglutamate amidohydrolase [Litoreibacter albidus]|uniref:N-formylglutamate amidohydrolase n=1 Tax=Litoreibacter albidus TaxID=670155 RepID=A0A1H3A8T4_9RHOB|nr:N-formylglutamate amidohydrolase [Litoreibacter albidus]SDX26117.1 N-formylglutamate amidohydrolase [Litoreibacter albidus]
MTLPENLLNAINGTLHVNAPALPSCALVFDSPHSGLTLPDGFKPSVDAAMVRQASDTYVDELFAAAPDIGAPLLVAEFPRSYLDVNRAVDDVDVSMIAGEWPHPVRPSAATHRGMGLAWKYAWGDVLMHDTPISVAEMEHRIAAFWHPYHDRLRALLDHTFDTYGRVYHVNCHSMPEFGHKLSPDPAGTRRADFVIGDGDGTTCDPAFVDCICNAAESLGYSVKRNDPFKGANLIRDYSDPARGRNSVQIELNRALYMNEVTRERSSGFAALTRDLTSLIKTMREFVETA